jgi:hypothetical protein
MKHGVLSAWVGSCLRGKNRSRIGKVNKNDSYFNISRLTEKMRVGRLARCHVVGHKKHPKGWINIQLLGCS